MLATIYEGIERCSSDAGYQAVVTSSGDDYDVQRSRVESLLGARVDGLVPGGARNDVPLVHQLVENGTKVVLTSRRLPGCSR